MPENRKTELRVAETVLPLPCFFPSVSSVVKTDMTPTDHIQLLGFSAHSLFLISAYDVANCTYQDRKRIKTALDKSKKHGAVILMDSGNYEGFWKVDKTWKADNFHEVVKSCKNDLCFCYDNHNPPDSIETIAEDVIARVIQDQNHTNGIVCPIIHGETTLLPGSAKRVAEQLSPLLLAIPERELGKGIIGRIRTIKKIRKSLNDLETYCPLHLLGTGDPVSIIAYSMVGADSFDGLEWCKSVIDHETGNQHDFQHWDFFRHQTNRELPENFPHKQSVLMHNLNFYRQFMKELHDAVKNEDTETFLRRYTTENQASLLVDAIKQ
ncbi:hypothetical protein F4Z98_12340 [Candidatus Poribacteria bacterium]|nr:hypothetical protein [Candidatus Poribacteria bacterium]